MKLSAEVRQKLIERGMPEDADSMVQYKYLKEAAAEEEKEHLAILEQFDKAEDESLESAKAIAEADPERLKGLTLEGLATEFMAVCMQVRYMQIRIAMLEKRPKRVEQLLKIEDDVADANNRDN